MDYGRAIRVTRAIKGLTQKQLAKEARLSQSYVSKLEVGERTPSMSVVAKIADALKVPRIVLTLLASETEDLGGLPSGAVAQEIGQTLVQLLFEVENAEQQAS